MKKLIFILFFLIISIIFPVEVMCQKINKKDIKKAEDFFEKGLKNYLKACKKNKSEYTYEFQTEIERYDPKNYFQKSIGFFNKSIEKNPYFVNPYFFRALSYCFEDITKGIYIIPEFEELSNIRYQIKHDFLKKKQISLERLELALKDFKIIKEGESQYYKTYNNEILDMYKISKLYIEKIENHINYINYEENGVQEVFFEKINSIGSGYYYKNCPNCFKIINDKRSINKNSYSAFINFKDGFIVGDFKIKDENDNLIVFQSTDKNIWKYYEMDSQYKDMVFEGEGSIIYQTKGFNFGWRKRITRNGKIIRENLSKRDESFKNFKVFTYHQNDNLKSEKHYIGQKIIENYYDESGLLINTIKTPSEKENLFSSESSENYQESDTKIEKTFITLSKSGYVGCKSEQDLHTVLKIAAGVDKTSSYMDLIENGDCFNLPKAKKGTIKKSTFGDSVIEIKLEGYSFSIWTVIEAIKTID